MFLFYSRVLVLFAFTCNTVRVIRIPFLFFGSLPLPRLSCSFIVDLIFLPVPLQFVGILSETILIVTGFVV
jgi:hypothetical protein